MGEMTAFRDNAFPYPVYGLPFTIVFPMVKDDGTLLASAAGLDSNVSLNGDTAVPCVNEATAIAPAGKYALTLTAAELTADVVSGTTTSTSEGALPTSWDLYPRKLPIVGSGTATGGAAGYILLAVDDPAATNQHRGCAIYIHAGTGAGQARVCTGNDALSKQATVIPEWVVVPDDDSQYRIYSPESDAVAGAGAAIQGVLGAGTLAVNLAQLAIHCSDGPALILQSADYTEPVVRIAPLGPYQTEAVAIYQAALGAAVRYYTDGLAETPLIVIDAPTEGPSVLISGDVTIPNVQTDINGTVTVLAAILDKIEFSGTGPYFIKSRNEAGERIASQAEVLAVQNNTRVRVIIPHVLERPDADETAYVLDLYIYDEAGNMETPDSTPTVSAQNQAGADRSGNLSAISNPATGHYTATYTVASTHAIEQVRFEWTIVEGEVSRLHGGAAQIVDTTAVDFTSDDRAKLEAVHEKLPTRAKLAGSTAATGSTEADAAAALEAYEPATADDVEAAQDAIANLLTEIKGAGWNGETLAAIYEAVQNISAEFTPEQLQALIDAVVAALGGITADWTPTQRLAILAALAAIQSKTALIGGLAVTYSSPAAADGRLVVYLGDDYADDDGRALTVTVAGWPGPDLTGCTGELRIQPETDWRARNGLRIQQLAATISQAGDVITCKAEPTAAVTAALRPSPPDREGNYRYAFIATLPAPAGRTVTVAAGFLTARNEPPAAAEES